MGEQVIYAPEKAQYLDEFMTELPRNCLFDKGKTGCGGTTLAIRNEKDVIIAMPYVSVINNKVAQHKDVLLGIHGDITEKEIIDYINTHEDLKFAVTYDSLERLIFILEKLGINVYERFFLLVDEWHILFNQYAFRNRAVKSLLKISQKFNNVTYMTATPIEDEFILEEIKNLPTVEVV